MYPLVNHNSTRTAVPSIQRARARRLVVAPLVAADEAEVMDFLSERPTRTFGMAGFIRDNGLVSPYNRGTFYGCRNSEGRLSGVALIGRFILFEARDEGVVEAFARTAQKYPNAHLLLGEQEEAQEFWNYYAEGGQAPRLFCCELLFELRWPVGVHQAVPGLRLATLDDLDLIVPSHARTVVEESGIDPLEVDPIGFRQRCQRRIEQGRSWYAWKEGS